MTETHRIAMFKPYVSEAAIPLVTKVLRSGWIGEGPKVKEFEKALCRKFDFKYALALNSGTAGVRLALALAGVGPGDEVITTPQTCTATNTAILEQFAIPVFADIQYLTGNLDPFDIEKRITPQTKAIICVHWAGYPCDLDEIHAVAQKYKLPVIEDGAHALGAVYRGSPIGTISDYTMFSFQAIKQLTTADGGLLTLIDEDKYHAGRRRRWFGIDRDNRRVREEDGYAVWDQAEVGYKYQMNDVAAAIGLGNMTEIDRLLEERHAMVAFYREWLRDVPGVTLFERAIDRESGDWLFTIHVERRGDFRRMMSSKGIDTGVAHIRNDVHPVFGGRRDDLPITDRYEKTHISIPLHNHLTYEDVTRVVEAIRGGW